MSISASATPPESPIDSFKKKVLLDLFVSPWTVVPVVGGLSAWMLSWGLDGVTALNLAGLAGVLMGAGIQATRLIFGLEEITADAERYLREQEEAEETARLDELERRLRKDGDPRTEKCLHNLRMMRAAFRKEAEEDGSPTTLAVRGKVEELYAESVDQLERSFELWFRARQLPRTAGKPLLEKRKAAVEEVVLTINHLAKTIAEYHKARTKEDEGGLARLRAELDQTVEMARRAEERIESLDREVAYDARNFK